MHPALAARAALSPLGLVKLDLDLAALIEVAYAQGFGPDPLPVTPPAGWTFERAVRSHGNLEPAACFGCLLEREADGLRVLAIRGTADPAEWIEDAEFWPERWPFNLAGGKTEFGFTDLISELLLDLKTSPIDAVVGHSLGAAIAEGVACGAGADYAGLWACPRLGDATFVKLLLTRVACVVRPFLAGDLVPGVPLDLPPFFAYQHPPGISLGAPAGMACDPQVRHALASYIEACAATAWALPPALATQ